MSQTKRRDLWKAYFEGLTSNALPGPARRGATTVVRANHYALLRTIETGFGLVALGNAALSTTPVLKGLLQPG